MASRQDQLERAFTYWGEVCAIQEERCASSSISPALAGLERVDEPAQPTQPRPAASIPPQRFLGAVGALALRKEALAEREAMIVGRAARGRAAEGASTVKWAKVSSVSAAGALVCAATQSASALPAGAASVFQRYKAALAAGGELPLPFTADKVSGYLAVYCELWGQKSSSLKSVVTHLRGFADHFGFPWLSPSGETAVDKARLLLERANPCEISHAESIMDDKVELMLRVLDKAEAGNMWALSLAALISLAHAASTRLNEPTHALRKDVVVSDKGVYFRRYFDKGSKRFQVRAHSDFARKRAPRLAALRRRSPARLPGLRKAGHRRAPFPAPGARDWRDRLGRGGRAGSLLGALLQARLSGRGGGGRHRERGVAFASRAALGRRDGRPPGRPLAGRARRQDRLGRQEEGATALRARQRDRPRARQSGASRSDASQDALTGPVCTCAPRPHATSAFHLHSASRQRSRDGSTTTRHRRRPLSEGRTVGRSNTALELSLSVAQSGTVSRLDTKKARSVF